MERTKEDFMQIKEKYYSLPLVSNGLKSVLEGFSSEKKCRVSKLLLILSEMKVSNTKNALAYSTKCRAINYLCEDGSVLLSFTPKEKELITAPSVVSSIKVYDPKNRQQGAPGSVAMAILNGDRPTMKLGVVSIEADAIDRTTGDTIKASSNFLVNREIGIAYNEGETTFEIIDEGCDEDYKEIKTQQVQSMVLKKSDFERFSNITKSHFLCSFEYKILEGEDIGRFYNSKHYYKKGGEKGSLWSSCMRNESASRFAYYMTNPSCCKLFCAFSEGKLIGRALLWIDHKGDHYLDRVYSVEDYVLNGFIAEAVRRGWNYKAYAINASHNTEWMVNNNGVYEHRRNHRFYVKLDVDCSYKNKPYIDTLTHIVDSKYGPMVGIASVAEMGGNNEIIEERNKKLYEMVDFADDYFIKHLSTFKDAVFDKEHPLHEKAVALEKIGDYSVEEVLAIVL